MTGDADLAALGSVLGERARARMLLALGDGRALAASVPAGEAGVAPSTAGAHLARLVDAGPPAVAVQGRHRDCRLAGPHVAAAPSTSPTSAGASSATSSVSGCRGWAPRPGSPSPAGSP
jgi:hypothetical protein